MIEKKLYHEDQLRESGLHYFKGDILATNVWIKKYALKSKEDGYYEELNPNDTLERIAKEIYRAELKYPNPLSYKEILKVIKDFKYFIFAGSILFGLGNNNAVSSLGNCFFIDNGADSYGGIFNLDESMVQLMKRRGGVGITLENLRPASANVNNSAASSTGSISFMNRYSESTREVAQDGRRGALMMSHHINHPDIPEFIVAKNDLTKITGANISVKITDEFMRAVESNEDYILSWPTTNNQYKLEEQIPYNQLMKINDKYVKRVKAKDLWNNIVKQAHKNAEPGVLFWDNVINESPADSYAHLGFETKGTNPCITGDTLIAVADGRNAVSIKQLAEEGKDVPVYSADPNTGQTQIKWGRNPRLTKKNAEVWKLILDDGSELIATPDHKILTSNLVYKELKDLNFGESIVPFYSFESNKYRQISKIGAKMKGGNFRNRRQYRAIYEFHNGNINEGQAIHHKDFNNQNDRIENLQSMTFDSHVELHSERIKGEKNPYHKMSDDWKHNFASHPGELNGKFSGFTNDELIIEGKKLFKTLGKITRKEWYKYAESNNLPKNVSTNFRFGSFTNFKNQVAENHKVVSVKYYGIQDVYNITVDDNHNYHVITSGDDNYITSSGICVKNCGEVPLSPYDSCRLGSINLFNLVTKPFTENAKIDWSKLAKMSSIAQRFMDDIIELEEEKVNTIIKKINSDPELPEIKRNELLTWEKVLKVLKDGRRTGVGVLGVGDMLAALGIKYGSKKSTEILTEIHKCIAVNSYRESVNLAKERGAFKIWNADIEAGNPFITRVISDNFNNNEYNEYLKYGRRNIATMSIAPTGSLAILGQTTSGIEPVFKVYYRRRRKINPNEEGVKVTFVDDNGDSWEEYNVIHHPFITWFMNEKNDKEFTFEQVHDLLKDLPESELDEIVSNSPWGGSESHDIDYLEKVTMQGSIQKWIDHSISVTHNLPENISVKEVNDIYFHGWKSGCKGLTIYREGSRSGVLITKDEKKEDEFKESKAPKRPKELPGDYYVAKAAGKEFAVIIGRWIDNDRPYEIFAFENPPSPKNTTGKIIKVKKGHFKFVNGEFEISDLQLAAESIEERSLTLTASMLLRHGAPIKHVINVIKKIDENITSFSSVVRRYLARYIEEEIDGESCPHCGDKLIMQDGCVKCINPSCGYSKCG